MLGLPICKIITLYYPLNQIQTKFMDINIFILLLRKRLESFAQYITIRFLAHMTKHARQRLSGIS